MFLPSKIFSIRLNSLLSVTWSSTITIYLVPFHSTPAPDQEDFLVFVSAELKSGP
jgi:hypothetical protein